jgi:hypothetical protein
MCCRDRTEDAAQTQLSKAPITRQRGKIGLRGRAVGRLYGQLSWIDSAMSTRQRVSYWGMLMER